MPASSFRDLEVWQQAHGLALAIYEATRRFPDDERFGLTSQIRRAAVSVPANIAEGFRKRGTQDKIRFYNIAEGSLAEVQYYLILAYDLGYLSDVQQLSELAETVGRMLYRYIEAIRVGDKTKSARPSDR